jgi:hypothetical protein
MCLRLELSVSELHNIIRLIIESSTNTQQADSGDISARTDDNILSITRHRWRRAMCHVVRHTVIMRRLGRYLKFSMYNFMVLGTNFELISSFTSIKQRRTLSTANSEWRSAPYSNLSRRNTEHSYASAPRLRFRRLGVRDVGEHQRIALPPDDVNTGRAMLLRRLGARQVVDMPRFPSADAARQLRSPAAAAAAAADIGNAGHGGRYFSRSLCSLSSSTSYVSQSPIESRPLLPGLFQLTLEHFVLKSTRTAAASRRGMSFDDHRRLRTSAVSGDRFRLGPVSPAPASGCHDGLTRTSNNHNGRIIMHPEAICAPFNESVSDKSVFINRRLIKTI